MSYADKAICPVTGRLRSFAEITAGKAEAEQGARIAQALAKHETEASKPEIAKRIEMYERQIAEAKHNDDHGRARMYKDKLADLKTEYEAQQAAAKKAAMFQADQRISLIRVSADSIDRSGHAIYPNASELDRQMLVSIARSNEYPNPESQYRDFQELADRLDQRELEVERVKASDAAIASAKAGLENAQAQLRTAEIEKARHDRTVPDAQP
jgi:hypothetical protein